MTSHYRHRRIYNPAASLPPVIEPGEIAVNTANRQIAVGDADPASSGSLRPLIGVRYFDVKAQYVGGEFVVQAGVLYRSKDVVLPGAFNAAQWESYISDPATKAYIDAADTAITDAFTGADAAITAGYQAADTALTSAVNGKVSKSGDNMTGPLQLAGTPHTDLEAATKKYVDDTVATGGTTPHADQIITVPSGGLSSGNVQAQLYELDLEKAPLASPQFSGNARAPTPAVDDRSISIATTAFVAGQGSNIAPLPAGIAAPGTSIRFARDDHVHPSDTSLAPINNPIFTGNPQAPTPPPGDNDKSIATTEFVQGAMVGVSGFSTGDAKLTFKATADPGWVMMNDGTIGDAASGATTRAGDDCQPLYNLLWNAIPQTYCPVVGGRGSSAGADWAAHKALTLPRALGRALAVAGNGASLSGRALGQFLGEENHTLIAAEQANMALVVNSMTVTINGTCSVNVNSYTGGYSGWDVNGSNNPVDLCGSNLSGSNKTQLTGTMAGTVTGSGATGTGTGTTTGGGNQPHNNMQPTSFFNVMVKL